MSRGQIWPVFCLKIPSIRSAHTGFLDLRQAQLLTRFQAQLLITIYPPTIPALLYQIYCLPKSVRHNLRRGRRKFNAQNVRYWLWILPSKIHLLDQNVIPVVDDLYMKVNLYSPESVLGTVIETIGVDAVVLYRGAEVRTLWEDLFCVLINHLVFQIATHLIYI